MTDEMDMGMRVWGVPGKGFFGWLDRGAGMGWEYRMYVGGQGGFFQSDPIRSDQGGVSGKEWPLCSCFVGRGSLVLWEYNVLVSGRVQSIDLFGNLPRGGR